MRISLGRPTYCCRRTYILLGILLLSFFFRQLLSAFAKRNRTKIGHMLGTECDCKTHVRNLGYLLPYKSGSQNHLFRRFRNFTATLTAYVFGTKHNIDNRISALTTTWGLLHRRRMSWTLVQKRLKLDLHFTHPPYIMRFFFIAGHPLQTTELNQTLPHGRG